MSKIHQNTRDWYFSFRCLGCPVAFTVGWLSPTSGGHCSVARIFFWADLEGKKRSESSALEMGPWDCGTRQWDQLPCHGPDSIVWSQHISQLRFDSWLVSEHTARGFHGDQSLGTSTSGVHQLGGMHFSGSGRRISLFKIRKIKKRTDRSITR